MSQFFKPFANLSSKSDTLLGLHNKLKRLQINTNPPGFAQNAYCSPVSDVSGRQASGNILLHPYMVKKTMEYVSSNSLGDLDVHVKKSSIRFKIRKDDTIEYVNGGNLFRYFEKSDLTTMKYTFIVTSEDEYEETEDFVVEILISPIADLTELLSKHILLRHSSTIGQIVFAGEFLVEKDADTPKKLIIRSNFSSGTFFNLWGTDVNDFGDDFQFPPEERIRFMSSLIERLLTYGTRHSFFFEDGHLPSSDFQRFESQNKTAVLLIADIIDRGMTLSDADDIIVASINRKLSRNISQSKSFDDLSKEVQDRVHQSYSLAVHILKRYVRPHIYSSVSVCGVILALLSLAPYIVSAFESRYETSIIEFILSLDNDKISRVLDYVATNSCSMHDIDKRNPILSSETFEEHINKNMFLDYTDRTFTNLGEVSPNFPDIEKLVVGGYIDQGNFGKVHKVREVIFKNESDAPSTDTPLTVKIVPVYRTLRVNNDFVTMDLNLVHNQSIHPESWSLLDLYSKSYHSNLMEFILMEELEKPRFRQDATKIIMDIIRDTVRVYGKGYVHNDIKPDNIMRKSNGKHILIDGGGLKRKYIGFSTGIVSTPSYSSQNMYRPVVATKMGEEEVVSILEDFIAIVFTYMEISMPDLFDEYEEKGLQRDSKREYLGRFSDVLDSNSSLVPFHANLSLLIKRYLDMESGFNTELYNKDSKHIFENFADDLGKSVDL